MKKITVLLGCLISAQAMAVSDDFTQLVADLSVGRVVEKSSLEFKRAKVVLSEVEKLCEEKDARKTGDQSEAASKYLREQGISANIIDTLEAVATLKTVTDQSCQDIIVQYAQNRASGASHTGAVVQLNSLYKILGKGK